MIEPKTAMEKTVGKSWPAQASSASDRPSPPTSKMPDWTATSRPVMRPEGMGRFGSLMASRSRSYLPSLNKWEGGKSE